MEPEAGWDGPVVDAIYTIERGFFKQFTRCVFRLIDVEDTTAPQCRHYTLDFAKRIFKLKAKMLSIGSALLSFASDTHNFQESEQWINDSPPAVRSRTPTADKVTEILRFLSEKKRLKNVLKYLKNISFFSFCESKKNVSIATHQSECSSSELNLIWFDQIRFDPEKWSGDSLFHHISDRLKNYDIDMDSFLCTVFEKSAVPVQWVGLYQDIGWKLDVLTNKSLFSTFFPCFSYFSPSMHCNRPNDKTQAKIGTLQKQIDGFNLGFYKEALCIRMKCLAYTNCIARTLSVTNFCVRKWLKKSVSPYQVRRNVMQFCDIGFCATFHTARSKKSANPIHSSKSHRDINYSKNKKKLKFFCQCPQYLSVGTISSNFLKFPHFAKSWKIVVTISFS